MNETKYCITFGNLIKLASLYKRRHCKQGVAVKAKAQARWKLAKQVTRLEPLKTLCVQQKVPRTIRTVTRRRDPSFATHAASSPSQLTNSTIFKMFTYEMHSYCVRLDMWKSYWSFSINILYCTFIDNGTFNIYLYEYVVIWKPYWSIVLRIL